MFGWVGDLVKDPVGFLSGDVARAKESAKNRRFQERMRNTQWQAAVSDMEAAGLNPALAYSQGPNAAPGGSMAAQQGGLGVVSSAMQAKRLAKDLQLLDEQIKKTKEETRGAQWAADTTKARLQAYGIERTNTGRLRFKVDPGDLPRMTREIDAAIEERRARAMREGYTAETLKPLADLASEMGMILPILGLISQMNPGGVLKGVGSLRRKPTPNVTKYIRNYWPGKGRR